MKMSICIFLVCDGDCVETLLTSENNENMEGERKIDRSVEVTERVWMPLNLEVSNHEGELQYIEPLHRISLLSRW